MNEQYGLIGAGIIAVGAVCTAVWSVLRLNQNRKDTGKEEQRILDKLEFLTRAHREQKEVIDRMDSEIGLLRNIMQEFQIENQKQHNDLEKKFVGALHDVDKRIQKLELRGCEPAKK